MLRHLSRRQFLLRGTALGMGLVGVMLSIPALGFLFSPLFTQRRTAWVTVGPLDDVPIGTPTPLTVDLPADQGWPTPPQPRVVYVVRPDADWDHTLALSNICTHMQCDVHWDVQLGQFLCPCHGGLYDMTGKNIGGPPPQPLAQWIHQITYNPQTDQHILSVQNQLDESI
jgi:quinol---cytochrome c reductase iron-sulfur subunit, bacillus type